MRPVILGVLLVVLLHSSPGAVPTGQPRLAQPVDAVARLLAELEAALTTPTDAAFIRIASPDLSGDQFVGGVGAGGGGPDDEAVARAMVKAMGFTNVEDKRAR